MFLFNWHYHYSVAQLQSLSSPRIYLPQLEIESHLNLDCHLDMVLDINMMCEAFAKMYGYGLM